MVTHGAPHNPGQRAHTSGPLHWLFFPGGALFPQVSTWLPSSPPSGLLKCHLLSDTLTTLNCYTLLPNSSF